MPHGPKPNRVIKFDDVASRYEQPRDEQLQFTCADDKILMDVKDEIINAPNEKAVYWHIQEKVRLAQQVASMS